MSSRIGLEMKLYRNTGSYATPVWTLMNNVSNVTRNLTKGEADVTTRGNNGWRALRGTLKELDVSFEMVYDPESSDFSTIEDAFMNNTAIEFALADGAIATSGTRFLRVTCDVFELSSTEENEEAVKYEVNIKPTFAANPPEFVDVA